MAKKKSKALRKKKSIKSASKAKHLGTVKKRKSVTTKSAQSKKTGAKAKPTELTESPLQLKRRVQKAVALLERYYPDAECALHHKNPLQLLIATILSAQCTDERVNQVTKTLFKKYPDTRAFAQADLSELEQDVRSTGFYKNKAKNIKSACQELVKNYNGEVPRTLPELVNLAGVGRKTANVVLGNAFGITSGIVVDTHVTRLSNRLGWVETKNAEIIERELQKLVPEKHWVMLSHWLIHHGRTVCKARKPQCEVCFLDSLCPKRI